jgi:hypothetical protein
MFTVNAFSAVNMDVYISISDCNKCNRNILEIIEFASKRSVKVSYYTDAIKSSTTDEFFEFMNKTRKDFKSVSILERSYVSIYSNDPSYQTVKIPLYLVDLEKIKNVLVDYELVVKHRVKIKKIKSSTAFLPKPTIAVLGNHILSTNYTNSTISNYNIGKTTINKLSNFDNYIFQIVSQIIFPETVENVDVLKLWQTNDSCITLLISPIYDSSGVNAYNYMLNFIQDTKNEFGLRYISFEKLPYNLVLVDTIQVYANYRANYYKHNGTIIGQLYCPTGDINANNQRVLEEGYSFYLPVFFSLDSSTKQLKYYSNKIPDNAVKHASYYFNLEYNIRKKNDSVFLASERYLNYISVINDTVKYRFSNTSNNSECYTLGAKRQLQVLSFSVINTLPCIIIKDQGDYHLKIFSINANQVIYDKKLTVINPSFSSYDNKIMIVETKGVRLNNVKISEIIIDKNELPF